MIYENVKKYADKKGISISVLEENAGIKKGTIGRWEILNPKAEHLKTVATILDVTIDKLLE